MDVNRSVGGRRRKTLKADKKDEKKTEEEKRQNLGETPVQTDIKPKRKA